jgi:hypothetical protein
MELTAMKTSNSMFRTIKNDEDVSDIVRNFFIWVFIVAVFVACGIYLAVTIPEHDNPTAAYQEQLERQAATPEGQQEWLRLSNKHGRYQLVVYEPGQTAYYKCGQNGKEKCKFL